MRFVLLLLSILLLGAAAHQWMPWFAIVIIAFLLGLFFKVGGWQGFLAGFLAGFLLWGGYAAYLSYLNENLLATRVGQLIGGTGPLGMVALTAILGGLMAGLGALSGVLGRNAFS